MDARPVLALILRCVPIALLAVLGACGPGPAAGASAASGLPRVAEADVSEQACSRDVECTLVDDCCGCAAGGMRTAVRSELVDVAVERSVGECAQRSCGARPSEHRSCQATAARCLGGRCVPQL